MFPTTFIQSPSKSALPLQRLSLGSLPDGWINQEKLGNSPACLGMTLAGSFKALPSDAVTCRLADVAASLFHFFFPATTWTQASSVNLRPR